MTLSQGQRNCQRSSRVCILISAVPVSYPRKTLYLMNHMGGEVSVLGSSAVCIQKMRFAAQLSVYHERAFLGHHYNLQTKNRSKPTKGLYSEHNLEDAIGNEH